MMRNMIQTTDKPQVPCRCGQPSVKFGGSSWRCALHARIYQMRRDSKGRGLHAPTREELEGMFAALDGMKCPACGRVMGMFKSLGATRVVTIQHNDDGTCSLLCQSCNAIDGNRTAGCSATHWRCWACDAVKPLAEFPKTGSKRNGRAGRCKACTNAYMRAYGKAQRAAGKAPSRAAYFRARRAAKKARTTGVAGAHNAKTHTP